MITNGVFDRLELGDHICAPICGDGEPRRVAAVTARAGIARGQKVVFFTDDEPGIGEALRGVAESTAAIDRGQLQVHPATEGYFPGGVFHPDDHVESLAAQMDLAQREGYSALRITGDLSRCPGAATFSEAIIDYESRVNTLFTDGTVIAVCHYNARSFDAETWRHLVSAHLSTSSASDSRAVARLRVLRTPTGVRLIGEADLANQAALTVVLTEVASVAEPFRIDASGLRFADARTIGWLLRTAAIRGDRTTAIDCTEHLAESLRIMGSEAIAHLTVTTVADPPNGPAR